MNRRVVFVSLLALIATTARLSADESAIADADSHLVTIPLDQVWSDYTPGTRDILTLEPEVFSSEASERPVKERDRLARNSLINRIAAKLQPAHKEKPGPTIMPVPRPAFVVEGTGRAALAAACDVFEGTHVLQKTFPPGRDLGIVFSSCQAGSRVELRKIEREGKTIKIYYRFYADGLTMTTSHLALIPLGQLPAGDYRVEIVQLPMDGKAGGKFAGDYAGRIMSAWGRELVCKPFSFSVVEDRN